MKPYKIFEDLNDNKDTSTLGNERAKEKIDKSDSTWLNGPAAFWYEKFQPDDYIIKPVEKAVARRTKKNKYDGDADETSSASDEEVNGESKTERKSPKAQSSIETATDCNTINLTESLKSLKVEEEKFLLVSTTDWEENILIELNPATNTDRNNNSNVVYVFNQSEEMINERIKYAGWIPSSEHRTLYSYQSKVLGKVYLMSFLTLYSLVIVFGGKTIFYIIVVVF